MKNFLDLVMNKDIRTTLTICGSYKNRALKEKYQAYYTLKNNLVFMPVNYYSVMHDIEPSSDNIEILHNIHDEKISLSEAIIVVTGDDGYFGKDTSREIDTAYINRKKILHTHIPEDRKEDFYFNNDLNYPLYMLKEEYM